VATKNAIDSNSPIEVSKGGTGNATLTDHSPLIGSGTGAISDVTVGTTGLLFLGSTGADPFFDDTSDGDFEFYKTASGTQVSLEVTHTSNTANSSTSLEIVSGGASGGDAQLNFVVSGVTTVAMGIDNSDSDQFKISASNALGTTDTFTISPDGEVRMPLQPAFLAYLGTTEQNVSGDGTAFTFGSNNALTEVYDQGGDFNTNGTFTAPVAGKYIFSCSLKLFYAGGPTEAVLRLQTTLASYRPHKVNLSAIGTGTDYYALGATVQVNMDAADTATFVLTASGGTKYTDIIATARDSFFSGRLIC
jgi:hypothetical protein